MAKGENIFRRRDGRWEARYIKGRELSGKIKYGYCYGKTYRDIGKPKRKPQSAKQLWQMELPYRQPERKNRSPAIAWDGYIQRNAR